MSGYNIPQVKDLCVLTDDALDINRMSQVEHLSSVPAMTEGQARSFFEKNHVTQGMTTLLRGALKRLNDQGGQGIYELRQAMGGGKTHNMIALGLLARFPALAGLLPDDITEGIDLKETRVAVFNGRSPKQYMWGDIALQLGGERFSHHWKGAPLPMTEADWEDLIGDQPTLIMLDELPPYLSLANAMPASGGTLLTLLTYSLSNLLSAAMKLPRCVVVIGSLDAAYDDAGEALSEAYASATSDLKKETARGAKSITPVDLNTGEIYDILRKRLFKALPDRDGDEVQRVVRAYAQSFQEAVRGKAIAKSSEQLADEISASYPFHPGYKDVLSLFKENPKFRQTRGLIEFTSNLLRAAWNDREREIFLIGAQNLDFADVRTRDQVKDIEKSLEGALAQDVYDRDGSAHAQIIDARTGGTAAREIATLLFVTSLSDNTDGIRGLRVDAIAEHLLAPGRDPVAIHQAFEDLRKECWYLHTRDGERFYFSDLANVRKQIEDKMSKVQADQVDAEMRRRLSMHFEPKRKLAYQDLVVLPTVTDMQLLASRRTCFVLSPDAKDPPATAQTIFENAVFKNMFCVVSSDGSKMASAEDVVRRIIAITYVNENVSEERHKRELAGELSTAERDFVAEAKSLFNTVWYPTDKGLRSTKLEFEAKSGQGGIDGEAAVERALAGGKIVAVEDDTMTRLMSQAEDRLFGNDKRMRWTDIQERAASRPQWPWLEQKGLERVRQFALDLGRWSEENGYVDIDPAPAKPSIKVAQDEWKDAKGAYDVELAIADAGKSPRIVTADTREGLANGTVVDREHETAKIEGWYQVEDTETGTKSDPIFRQGKLKLAYDHVARGDEWEVTFEARPSAEIRWNTTGANPKEGRLYEGPFRVSGRERVTLYVHAQSGGVSETKAWPLSALVQDDGAGVAGAAQDHVPEGRVRLDRDLAMPSKGQVLRAMHALRKEPEVRLSRMTISAGDGDGKIMVRTGDAGLSPQATQDLIDAIVKASGNPDAELDLRVKASSYPDFHMMKAFLDSMDQPFTMRDVGKEA